MGVANALSFLRSPEPGKVNGRMSFSEGVRPEPAQGCALGGAKLLEGDRCLSD